MIFYQEILYLNNGISNRHKGHSAMKTYVLYMVNKETNAKFYMWLEDAKTMAHALEVARLLISHRKDSKGSYLMEYEGDFALRIDID